jgi:hypothetical protein
MMKKLILLTSAVLLCATITFADNGKGKKKKCAKGKSCCSKNMKSCSKEKKSCQGEKATTAEM